MPKKSYVRIENRRDISRMTTSSSLTLTVKTCMMISGVKSREVNGNTLIFVSRSLMWLVRRITIIIITKTVIAKIHTSSAS